MAPATRRFQQGARRRTRRGLSPAIDAEAVGVAGGHRRRHLFLRQRSLRQVDRQHPQCRRRQRAVVHAVNANGRETSMTGFSISEDFLQSENATRKAALDEDYAALSRTLARRGVDSEALTRRVMAFGVAIPTWGVGTGGTRFARFPGPGEPRHLFDKLEDCATIHRLARATPTISAHFPWDA